MTRISNLKKDLKKLSILKNAYQALRFGYRKILYKLSPVLMVKYLYFVIKGEYLNLRNPQTFDEKLIWMMLFWQHPLKTKCTDKYTVRSYVEECGLGNILPELIGVYENSNQIDFEALPNRFVLKCTHGCGYNIICDNKSKLDFQKTKQQLNKWMRAKFGYKHGELHYDLIKPRIICERFIDTLDGNLPCDYKVYCFHGEAKFTMACTGRSFDNKNANFDFYDRIWKRKLPYSKSSLLANRDIPKPEAYEEIISAADKLSQPFPFVRMDFYSSNGRALLGEMTFTPSGCIDTGYTDFVQQKLGKMITLPEKLLK